MASVVFEFWNVVSVCFVPFIIGSAPVGKNENFLSGSLNVSCLRTSDLLLILEFEFFVTNV